MSGCPYRTVSRRPETAIVVISASDDLALVADLMRTVVERKSYLLKQSIYYVLGLVRIIEAMYEGHTILDSGIIQRMATCSASTPTISTPASMTQSKICYVSWLKDVTTANCSKRSA